MWITVALLIVSGAYALEECSNRMTPNDIPCNIISTWEYESCVSTTAQIYNSTPALITTTNFSDFGLSGRCNITWNISEIGTYFLNVSNGDAIRITIQEEEDEMASLAVTLFVLVVTISVFIIAFKVNFTNSRWANMVIKNSLILFGLFLMSLNTVIVVTIADVTGLGVEQELFRYLWLFNWTIYIGMIILFFTSIKKGLEMWKIEKTNRRMGDYGED